MDNNFESKLTDEQVKNKDAEDAQAEYRFIGLQPKEKRKAYSFSGPNEMSEYGSENDEDEEDEQGSEVGSEYEKSEGEESEYDDEDYGSQNSGQDDDKSDASGNEDDDYEGGQPDDENLDLIFFFVSDS